MNIKDMIAVEGIDMPKTSEYCFQLILSTKTMIFKVATQEEKEEWIMLLEASKLVSSSLFPLPTETAQQFSWSRLEQSIEISL